MSDNEEKTQKRTAFIAADIKLLMKLIEAQAHVLENKVDRPTQDMKRNVWMKILKDFNARQIGGIKTMRNLQYKYKNEKKFAKQRTTTNKNENQNTEESIQLRGQESVNSQWIKIDESEDFQDSMFDENVPLKRPASQSPLSFSFNRTKIQNDTEGLNELKEEGLKLDNEYKQLLIEKIQLEKKVLFQKSQLEKVKLELEIKKLKMELSHK